MIKHNYITLLLLVIVLISCEDTKQKEIQRLQKEVISVHDEVMPKMGQLHKMEARMMHLGDSLQMLGAADSSVFYQKAEKFRMASQSMMDWMHAFNIQSDTLEQDEAIIYLQNEKVRIERVKELTTQALMQDTTVPAE